YPLLADPLSQLRGCHNEEGLVISSYDAFLRHEGFSAHYRPQLVLRFGALPTSKPVLLYLKRYPGCPQVIIDGQDGWEEPTQLATQMAHADPATFCRQLCAALAQPDVSVSEHTLEWTRVWRVADQVTRQALSSAINDLSALFEGRVFTELAELLP